MQAVKYLERMLIQAQNQKECQRNAAETDGKNMTQENPSDPNESSGVKVKTETNLSADNVRIDESLPAEIMSDVEMKDLTDQVKIEAGEEGEAGAQQPAEARTNKSPDETPVKEINIDPKTYCKLGHFHLLLEDYQKGMYGR